MPKYKPQCRVSAIFALCCLFCEWFCCHSLHMKTQQSAVKLCDRAHFSNVIHGMFYATTCRSLTCQVPCFCWWLRCTWTLLCGCCSHCSLIVILATFMDHMCCVTGESMRFGDAPRSYSARTSPPHSVEHMLVFPGDSGNISSDSNWVLGSWDCESCTPQRCC